MYYHEEYCDLFSIDRSKYALAHCISADFALGAGIAVRFNTAFNIRNILNMTYYSKGIEYFLNTSNKKGYCIYIDECKVFNLVTKANYYDKPTYASITNAIIDMANIALLNNIKYIAMPMIGCGLDRLNWSRVSNIIKKIFKDTDIEILICKV